MWCVTITLCSYAQRVTAHETVCSVVLHEMQRSCNKHQVPSYSTSIPHPGMLPWKFQTHGLADDTIVSPECSDAPEPSQSQPELSSEEVGEATLQGSNVSDTSPIGYMQSLVASHQVVTGLVPPPQSCRSPLSLLKEGWVLMKNQRQPQ